MSLIHRAVTALVSSALAVSLVAAGAPAHAAPSPTPAQRGGDWLADQLTGKGLIHNKQFKFDDYGLTIDTAFALQAISGHGREVRTARNAVAANIDGYITGDAFGDVGSHYAGATAKSLVLAQDTGGDPADFGGIDLVESLSGLVTKSGPSRGRIADVSTFGDNANTLGQVFAVRGLLKAGQPEGRSALAFLLAQQCKGGSFRLGFNADKDAADQACRGSDAPDPDATALAVIELAAVAKGHGNLKDSLTAATRWLSRQQHANGSLGGSGPTSAANANSTGLAGWAFLTEGRCGAARDSAGWVAHRQVTGHLAGTELAREGGAIGYDDATLEAAQKNGIVTATRDKWRRATAQAAPALLALTHCKS